MDTEQPPVVTEPPKSSGDFDSSDFVNSYVATIKKVLTEPRDFFAALPTNAGYGAPLIYLLPAAAISGFLSALVGPGQSGGAAFAALILAPIAAIIGSFIGAALLHASSYIFAEKAKGGYEGTWRVVAYSYGSIAWITWIPVIGFLGSLYAIYVTIMGIEGVHGTSTSKAATAVLVLVGIAILLGIILAAILAFVVGASLLGSGAFPFRP